MAKDVNWTSQEWCDIVFEGKNKDYGAYKIRRTTSKRHTIAMIAVLIVAICTAVLPTIVAKVGAEIAKRRAVDGLTTETKFSSLPQDEIEEKRNEVKTVDLPPPPEKQFKFTPPVITSSADMTEDDRMQSQEDLMNKDRNIGFHNIIDGIDATGTLGEEELRGHRNVTNTGTGEKIEPFVEVEPEFPGGMSEFYEFLRSKIVYPPQARELGLEGTTQVQFVVYKDGRVDDVKVYRSSYPLLDAEAVRVMKMSPKWIPGKNNGKAVSTLYRIPILFRLNQ